MKEQEDSEAFLHDVDLDTIKTILTYIYKGVIPDDKITVELLAASEMYEFISLSKICIRKLENGLDLKNVAKLWHSAYLLNFEELAHNALAFMAANWSILMQDEYVMSLTQKYPNMLVTISRLLFDTHKFNEMN